jgi:hypothetical protein
MPNHLFLFTLDEIKQKHYSLRHVSSGIADDKQMRETQAVQRDDSKDDEPEDDRFDTDNILSIPFRVRPELNRENTFMTKMIKAIFAELDESPRNTPSPSSERNKVNGDSQSLSARENVSDRISCMNVFEQVRRTELPAVSATFSFFVKHGESNTPFLQPPNSPPTTLSLTTSASEESPLRSQTPMTDTRSTLLSLQQDMMRVASEVGEELEDDSADIVAALTMPPTRSQLFFDSDIEDGEIELDDCQMVSGEDSRSESDSDNCASEDYLRRMQSAMEVMLHAHAEELSVCVHSHNEDGDQLLQRSNDTVPSQMRSTATVPRHRSGESRRSLRDGSYWGSHYNSARKHSLSRSFQRRRTSALAESVSMALEEFVSGMSTELNGVDNTSISSMDASPGFDTSYTSDNNMEEFTMKLYLQMDQYSGELFAMEEEYANEEKFSWNVFTDGLRLQESKSDATYESMMHEYVVELILTGDIQKAQALLNREPSISIPVSRASVLLYSLLVHYDQAVINQRTTADPPALEVIQFLINVLRADISTHKEIQLLLRKYYSSLNFLQN